MQDRPKKNCTGHQKKMTNHQELMYKFLQEWRSPQWSKENINLISWHPIVQEKVQKKMVACSQHKKHCNRNYVKRIKFSLQRISAKFYTCAFPSNGIATVGRMKCQEYHSGKCFPKWNENTLPEELWKESKLEITNVSRIQANMQQRKDSCRLLFCRLFNV